MKIDVITIFPGLFEPFFNLGIVSQSIKRGKAELKAHNLRDYALGKHKQVDDYPYGGGDGMVFKVEPIVNAVEALKGEGTRLLITSPSGRELDEGYAIELSNEEHILIICGRYRGVDRRVYDILNPEEFSLGRFVLSGGEIAAMALIESTLRLIPGVVRNSSSILQDTFVADGTDFNHYTRPRIFRGHIVPDILLTGHANRIEDFRVRQRTEDEE